MDNFSKKGKCFLLVEIEGKAQVFGAWVKKIAKVSGQKLYWRNQIDIAPVRYVGKMAKIEQAVKANPCPCRVIGSMFYIEGAVCPSSCRRNNA
jgi:hypothetical protein